MYPDTGVGEGDGNYALFVGRLSPEKGIKTLLRAWYNLKDITLKIVGDGPLKNRILEIDTLSGWLYKETVGSTADIISR